MNDDRTGVTIEVQRMTDEEAMEFYADPSNQQTGGPSVRRSGPALSTHVRVRFSPEMIAAVKRFADEDHSTVSTWIRKVVAREIEKRRESTTGLGPTTTPKVTMHGQSPDDEFTSATGELVLT
jgi:hypothetical protein